MDTGSVAYVRTEDAPQYAPPSTKKGAVGWIRDNLFDSVANSILTIVGIAILALIVPPVINWLFIDAVYTGDSRDACVVEGAGACACEGGARRARTVRVDSRCRTRWPDSSSARAARPPAWTYPPLGSLQCGT